MTLTGHMIVPPDRLSEVRAALAEHMRLTRAEPGCLRFDVEERADGSGCFDVSEEFADKAAFAAHQRRVKSSDWGRTTEGLERNYVIAGLDE